MIHWVLWHNAVCENKCDRAATWLARDLHTSLVLLPALTCNTTCACVCVRSQLISCCVWLSHGDTFLYVWKAWNRSETPHYTLAAVMEAASVCFIFAVVEQTETRKRKQQEKPTKQIKTRPTQTLTAAERDDTFLIAVPQASDIYQIFKKTTKKKRLWWCSHCCLNSNMCSSSSQRGCRVRAQREVGQQKPCSSRLYIKDGHHKLIGALEFRFWVVTCWFFRLHY